MKHLLFFTVCLLFFACEPSTNQEDNKTEETNTQIAPDQPEAPTPGPGNGGEKRKALLAHLAENVPNYKALIPQLWLPPQYIEDYNANDQIEEKISYEENTLIFGDFNGDQKEDAVGLLMKRNGEVWLMALFAKEGGYDLEPIFPKDEGTFTKCCVGVGLKTLPAGEYTDINSGKKVQVPYDGIEYQIYEKVSFLTYLDGTRFQTIQLSD